MQEVTALLQKDPSAGQWLMKILMHHPRPLANDKELVLYLTAKRSYEQACLRTSAALAEAYRGGDASKIIDCDAAATRAIDELARVHSLAYYKGTALRRYRTWIVVVAAYLVGCLLLYSGLATAVLDFCGSPHTWSLKPEPDFLESLVEAVVTLVRPFLAVGLMWIVVGVCVAIPAIGLFCLGASTVRFLKRLVSRDND